MPLLTILPAGRTVDVMAGMRLLDAIRSSGEPFVTRCNGNVQCGSCHVFVHDGRKSLSKIARIENDKLDGIVGVSSKSRLACQALLGEEDVTVEVLGYKSGL